MKRIPLTIEEKQARVEQRRNARSQEKESARIESEKNQRHVQELTITIEWSKSRMWGNNPHASVEVHYVETQQYGNYAHKDGYTASGCGYDKESTVIAEIFNEFLKYKLWELSDETIKGGLGSNDNGPAPYGISIYKRENGYGESRYYSGGIGTSCYYPISEYIGGKFEHIASGKTFDVYKYTDGEAHA